MGLGPGDPGLVTVRAAEILRSAPVVAYPVDATGDPGRAFQIARPYLAPDVIELPLAMPMTSHRPTLEAAWDAGVAAIAAETAAGRDVAYLCLGDTLLYGSFGYLLARYAGQVCVIPGVISPVAAASALREPLVEGREPLVIVPDGGDIDLLRGALALGGTVVIMKPSRLNAEAVALLERDRRHRAGPGDPGRDASLRAHLRAGVGRRAGRPPLFLHRDHPCPRKGRDAAMTDPRIGWIDP